MFCVFCFSVFVFLIDVSGGGVGVCEFCEFYLFYGLLIYFCILCFVFCGVIVDLFLYFVVLVFVCMWF